MTYLDISTEYSVDVGRMKGLDVTELVISAQRAKILTKL